MAQVNPKKLGALIDKHAQKSAPPKKPGGFGGGKPPSQHAKEEAKHEPGETPEHEQAEHEGGEHDESHDHEIAEQQAKRVANGNADDKLHELADDLHPGEDGEKAAPPEWAHDHDIWERAEKAVDALEDIDDGDRGLVLIHTYEALGGKIAGHDGDEHEGGEHEDHDEHEEHGEDEDDEHEG